MLLALVLAAACGSTIFFISAAGLAASKPDVISQ